MNNFSIQNTNLTHLEITSHLVPNTYYILANSKQLVSLHLEGEFILTKKSACMYNEKLINF